MRLRALAAALPFVLALGAVTAPVSQANSVQGLGITGFSDLIVDQAHQHVFVSQGTGSSVVVTDLNGVKVGTVSGLPGAKGMAFSDDHSTLFVALSTGDAVAAVDTETLGVTTFATGTGTCPHDVAVTIGVVWFGYGCSAANAGIGSLDPTTGTVTLGLADVDGALLETSPALPGSVLAVPLGGSQVYAYDATGGATPALSLRASRSDVGDNASDLAITPDGSQVITAFGYPYQHPILKTSDLSSAGALESDTYPNAVAVRPDGAVAAGVNGIYWADVYLYEPGKTKAFRSYETASSNDWALPSGLAFGSTDLYAMTRDNDTLAYHLHVITPRRLAKVTVATSSSRYHFGARVAVSATLSAAATHRTVTIYAQPFGGTARPIKTATVPVGGKLTVSYRVTGRTTFTARYAGDADFDKARAGKTVTATAQLTPRMVQYQGRSGKYYVYDVDRAARIQARVSPNHAGDCTYFRAQFLVGGHWGHDASTKCARLSLTSLGRAYLTGNDVYVGIPIRMRAEWRGDKQNLAANSGWRFVKFRR